MSKFARIQISDSNQIFDFPIDDGNSFPNLMMQCRQQGFLLDGRVNAYVPHNQIKYAFQIETEIVSGMTKQ
jgi:hypothetical protein